MAIDTVIPPTMTEPPTSPDPASPTTFDALAFPYMEWIKLNRTEQVAVNTALIDFITKANLLQSDVNDKQASASASATAAAISVTTAYATANFKGAWNSVTDFSNSSCEYLGLIYVSKVNPNINHIPTDTNSWTPLTQALILDAIPTVGSGNAITSNAVANATVGSQLYLYSNYGGF